VELYCGNMLEHSLEGATLVFSYNRPEPGGAFIHAMKRHLVRKLQNGACVLLRGQQFPAGTANGAATDDARSFLRDRTSWSVQLHAAGIVGALAPSGAASVGEAATSEEGGPSEPMTGEWRATFKRIEPALRTSIANRMWQCTGYRIVEVANVLLSLISPTPVLGDGTTGDDARQAVPPPEAMDDFTQTVLATNASVTRAVQRWIDDACAALEASGSLEPRILELREQRVPLGESPYERSIYTLDTPPEYSPPCIWDLADDF